jgi:hypothetical protein
VSTPDADPRAIDLTQVCWRKSSYSGGANDCVELAEVGDYVAVRDSKRPRQSPVLLTRSKAVAFVSGLKAGQFAPDEM